MKKIVLFICCVLIWLSCSAWLDVGGLSGSSSPVTPSNVCTGFSGIACEDWDAAATPNNERLVWVQDTDTGACGTITIGASPSGTFSCSGTYVLDFLFDADTAGDCFTYTDITDFTSTDTDYFVQVEVKLLDDGAMVNGSTLQVLYSDSTADPASPIPVQFTVVKTSAGATYEARAVVRTDAGDITIDNNAAISLDTKYELSCRWKRVTGADNDEFEFYLDGVSQNAGGALSDDIQSTNPAYLTLGSTIVGSANYSAHFQVDNLKITSSTAPTSCGD